MFAERIAENGQNVYRLHVAPLGFSTVFRRASMRAAMKAYGEGQLVGYWDNLSSSNAAFFAQKGTRIAIRANEHWLYWMETSGDDWERWWMVEVSPKRRANEDWRAFCAREREGVRLP